MTEKRFIVIDDGLDFIIRDTITDDYLIDADGVVDVLNDYEKENEQLKNNIKEAYENERTALGRSVLKQLIDKMEYD